MLIIPAKGSAVEKRYFIYTDYSNTPFRLTDSAGTIVWQWSRNPFGDNAPSVQTVTFNLRMPGQYYDIESGFHYNGARYYLPAAGRYLQPDPLGEAAGVSAYTYADGDAVNMIDQSGLSPGSTLYDHTLGSPVTVTANGAYSGAGKMGGFGFSMAGWSAWNDDPYYGPHSDFTPSEESNDFVSSMHGKQGIEPVYIIEELASLVAGPAISAARSIYNSVQTARAAALTARRVREAEAAMRNPEVARRQFQVMSQHLDGVSCFNTCLAVDALLTGRLVSPVATTRIPTDRSLHTLSAITDSLPIGPFASLREMQLALSKTADGTRGIVAAHRGNGVSGHVFNYKNTQGTVGFLDGSVGSFGTSAEAFTAGQGYTMFHYIDTTNRFW